MVNFFFFFTIISFFSFSIYLLYIFTVYIIYIYKGLLILNFLIFFLYYFMDFKEIKGTKHYLYDNEQEFKVQHPEIFVKNNWRNGEEGEWVFTDDNNVCQILRKFTIKQTNSKGTLCVRTVIGTFQVKNKTRKMLGEDGIAENIYSFSGKNVDGFSDNKTKGQFLFAQYVAQGINAIEAYQKAYPKAKSKRGIQKQVNKLLKVEHVQKMIKEEIQNCLNEEGVTAEWIIGRYKTIADLAERDSDKLRSLESLTKIAGLFETNDKKTEQLTVFAGFTPEQLEEVKNGKATPIAHASRSDVEEE